MESWAAPRWAPLGPVTASWLLGLLLSPGTLQLTGMLSAFSVLAGSAHQSS